jgi:hypothetical protein
MIYIPNIRLKPCPKRLHFTKPEGLCICCIYILQLISTLRSLLRENSCSLYINSAPPPTHPRRPLPGQFGRQLTSSPRPYPPLHPTSPPLEGDAGSPDEPREPVVWCAGVCVGDEGSIARHICRRQLDEGIRAWHQSQ